MPGQNKNPLLGWHPGSAEDAAWARAEAKRRGVPLARVLDEALRLLRRQMAEHLRDECEDECPHPRARVHKGLCGACGTNVRKVS